MAATIPEQYMDLLTGITYPVLVTLMPDGQPQGSVVWFSYDGEHIIVNTAKGRQKDRNMRERPNVTLVFMDRQNPYRFIEVRGRVVEVTEDGALEHIHMLSDRYDGRPDFYSNKPNQTDETRVIFKIEPLRVVGH